MLAGLYKVVFTVARISVTLQELAPSVTGSWSGIGLYRCGMKLRVRQYGLFKDTPPDSRVPIWS